jgi:hypothetical protein
MSSFWVGLRLAEMVGAMPFSDAVGGVRRQKEILLAMDF